ncbi:hypothetical protein ACHAXT_002016 [Thalassiosira profunda]
MTSTPQTQPLPSPSPGGGGDDATATTDHSAHSAHSDSLICGFGPRPRHRGDSTIGSSDVDDSHRTGGHNKSSLICGFGGDAGSSRASGDGSSDNLERMLAKLEGRAKTGRDDDGDGIGGAVVRTAPVDCGGRKAPAPQDRADDGATNVVTVSVPTKFDGASSANNHNNRPRGLPRSESSKSMGSASSNKQLSSDLSMASEDAVVLMINRLGEDGEMPGGGGGNGDDASIEAVTRNGKRPPSNVAGRVFKGQPAGDYQSIPTELELDSEVLEQTRSSWRAAPASATGLLTAGRIKEKAARRSSAPEIATTRGPPRGPTGAAGHAAAGRPKRIAPIDDKGEIESGNKVSQRASPPGPQPAVAFQPPHGSHPPLAPSPATINQHASHRRRRSDNLDVIREDDFSASASAGTHNNIKTSVASRASNASLDSAATSGDSSLQLDASRRRDPIGAHARSMARQLRMDGGPSNDGAPRRKKASKRGKRSERSKKRPQDEGRRAIVSRTPETDYVKVTVPKPPSVQTLLHNAIADNVLFKACSPEELTELVAVFAPSEASAGSTIIREGDEGDAFYVLERGTIDVYEGDAHKATLYAGACFGEIALLYGCPRSATLRTRYFCKLWSIGRTAFRAITGQFKRQRLEAKVRFLKKVQIKAKYLGDVLSESEIGTLALATLHESFSAGHTIVREGEPGDIFYMIDKGQVDVFIRAKGDAPVVTLTSGQFFGELALLSNDVRTASCVAKTDVECHILMRHDFNLLLGDLQSLLDHGGDYRRREEKFDVTGPARKGARAAPKVDLADLDVLKVLGIGAFGRVRLARLKRPVEGLDRDDGYFALKCISKDSLKENGLDAHIQNEKAIMAGLDHPFINRYYCDMEDEDYLYFLLEALPGGELCKRLRAEKQFPEDWGKFYSASVLFAFCHMHAKKIAYRDLKPENLVMNSVGYVKIVDFGLAKVINGGKTWTLCGTPAYLAPEIVLNDGHDWAVDYWALGVFLFEMTSGKEPFAAKKPMEVYKQIVSGHVNIPSFFSHNLSDLIVKLLNTSKSKRLGRTMGGGGAVMQHRWYADFDWDAHLEKKLEAPLQPKTQETLAEDSVRDTVDSDSRDPSDSRDSSRPSRPSNSASPALCRHSQNNGAMRPVKPPRLTYSLGQGNRHKKKLLEMMDNGAEQNVDTVRMTMMRVIKQHERWSKTSRESTNSSTRNTALGVGPKTSIRGSVHTEGAASVASSTFGENLDAFLRLQLMHLSLASKRDSRSTERDRAYQQFSLLSTSPSSLMKEKAELRACGNRFLDPFVTKQIGLVDQYPTGASESDIDAEALGAFCFPNGLRIRLVPRCAKEGARRLGWLGAGGDSYQLQGFTDVAGSLSHGCAITIKDEVTGKDAQALSSLISLQRERRNSASRLAKWWRRQWKARRPTRLQSSGPLFGAGRPLMKRANSMMERANSLNWGRKDSEESHNAAGVGLRGAMDKVMLRPKLKSASVGDLAFDETSQLDESAYIEETFGGPTTSEEKWLTEALGPPISDRARQLGLESYQAMLDAAKEGDICIVEKSYVLTGTSLKDQSLFFCALQNLIDMERKINDKAARSTAKRRSSEGEEGTRRYSFDPENRKAVLSALQSKLLLTPLQRRVGYPRDEMAHINNPQRRYVVDLSSIMGFGKISLPLPLPEVSGQWGLATLFLRIKDSGLLILLKLLLLERSVLVVGETSEEVTACTTALLELLDPYKWASAFMPLLPREMLDFVSSPVPFIAGMIVEGKRHLHSILHDHGVKDAMLHGLSIVNLVAGKLIVTREQGTSDMLRRSFQTIPELSLYQKRLEEYYRLPSSNLRSFQSFFKNGASPRESLTLRKVKKLVKAHMSQFTMGLNDRPDAWQQYGEFNEATGTFDFCPDKFIQPLKDRLIFSIQFQEMMAHTQLFVGYVEELQLAHEKRSNLLSGPSAQFIARWVELQMHKRYSR